MSGPEGELRNVLQSILMGVCTRCDFVHGEALRPSGNACLVQIRAAVKSTGASKAWQRCQAALDQRSDRTEEQMEQIIKFSKGIHFFKYITNAQRNELCKTMQHTIFKRGQVIMQGTNLEQHTHVWYVVIQGRVDMCVRTHAQGLTYRMCSFKEGDTFATSYMKMFITGPTVAAHIEAATDASCIVITIPEEYRNEFRTNTRPLWYEELAQYFHTSINEAADQLGMCMSAIKKICRRHGISRWPHRKLASVNKTVTMLQGKIASAEDETSRAALRSEAVNVLTMKLRLTINPSYLVRDETLVLGSGGSADAPPPGVPVGLPAGGHGGGGGRFGMGFGDEGDAGDRDPSGGGLGRGGNDAQRLLAQAEAKASASAAQVLHKVQSLARARQSGGLGDGGLGGGLMGGLGAAFGGMAGGMGGGLGQGMGGQDMLQRSLLMAGHAMGAGAGGALGRSAGGGHGKDDEGGDGQDDEGGPLGASRGGGGGGLLGGGGGGMGLGAGMGGYGLGGAAGLGAQLGQAHMGGGGGYGGYQGAGMGGGMGWGGQEAMLQQRMQEQMLQQRMQLAGAGGGFGAYGGMDGGLAGGVGGGMMLSDEHKAELGKRHGIDFLMSAGGLMEGDLMEKRMRHGGM